MSTILSVDEAFYVHTVEYYLEIGTYDMLMSSGGNKSEMIVYSMSIL